MKTAKQRYFDRVYADAKEVPCACGCGEIIKNKDKYGRDKKFISGHNGRKYEDPTQYKREWNHRNRDKRYLWKLTRGHELKRKVILLMGGRCLCCGLKYNGKNGCVFQLHHKEPKKKKFGINIAKLLTYSWKKVLVELCKCDLLCANCHFILEYDQY